MKRFFALFLCLIVLLSLVACAAQPQETTASTQPAETQPTGPVDDYDYPELKEKLSWEKLNSFPIKTSDMTAEEMRNICVDFMRYIKTALWIPNSDYSFIKTNAGSNDSVTKGTIYGGLPYIGSGGFSNVYRLLDHMDPETGVVDMTAIKTLPVGLFGTHCSGCTYWAWGRFINSTEYGSTDDMVQKNGFLRVGPYTYSDTLDKFDSVSTTTLVCQENGEQIMYQSYAQLLPADGLVYYRSAGHVIMCASVPHVEYIGGTDQIDGEKSYITICEQGGKWLEGTNESGDTYQYKNGVDTKMTFAKLFEQSYLPFTFAEFLGTDPVEETECSFSYTGDTISVKDLFSGKVTANYGISDIYAVVKDASGNEVYRHAVRVKRADTEEQQLVRNAENVVKWGTLDVTNGEFTVEVIAQLSTGERPTLYTGKLVP